MDNLSKQAQALLFAEGGALTFKSLEKSLSCDGVALQHALDALAQTLEGSGLSLVRSDTEATLAVSADAREVVAKKAADEYQSSIGEAGLEILSILLYEGPATRAMIDYIRGVNSSSSLRNLLARGLVERSGNPEDGREYVYRPTVELLAHLGVSGAKELPEYDTIARELSEFKSKHNEAFEHNERSNPANTTSSS
jgi:segregation and condensation protein B